MGFLFEMAVWYDIVDVFVCMVDFDEFFFYFYGVDDDWDGGYVG